jgi:putative membrane protein insertion efficiency factor
MNRIVAGLIRGYQLALSPYLGSSCRFHPTCSEYARQAVLHYGVLRGLWLASKRLARCHPWHAGGVDRLP